MKIPSSNPNSVDLNTEQDKCVREILSLIEISKKSEFKLISSWSMDCGRCFEIALKIRLFISKVRRSLKISIKNLHIEISDDEKIQALIEKCNNWSLIFRIVVDPKWNPVLIKSGFDLTWDLNYFQEFLEIIEKYYSLEISKKKKKKILT